MFADRQTQPSDRRRSPRVLMLIEQGVSSRYWEGAFPLLLARNTEVVLATLRERGPLHASLEALGCPVVALGCRTSWDYLHAAPRLAHIIEKHQIEIIHAHEAIPATVGGIAGVLARRGTRVFHRHHTSASGVQRGFSRVASRLAHLTLAVSCAAAKEARDADGVPPSRVRVAHNGIQPLRTVAEDELVALRRQLGIPPEAAVISTIARLRPEKGHLTLLEAARCLGSILPGTPHLAIVGNGPEEQILQERARSLRSVSVHFVGHQHDIAPWFTLADVVAVPSYEESFGLAAVEAMACSRPLVASRVGGLVEVVDEGVTGLLVTPQDPQGLADGLLRLLKSPATAARMGAAAYGRYCQYFTMDSMVTTWRQCYTQAIEQGGIHPMSGVVRE